MSLASILKSSSPWVRVRTYTSELHLICTRCDLTLKISDYSRTARFTAKLMLWMERDHRFCQKPQPKPPVKP